MRKTFSVISLGCPRNIVDSECIISEFKNKGYAYREELNNVDALIINTCAFIEDAKKDSIETILKAIDAKKCGSVRQIIVTGCLPQRYPRELKKQLKEIDEFRGIMNFSETFKEDARRFLTPAHYAYIKISEGCKNSCTYCIIPKLKGPYRSRDIESILKQAANCFQKSGKEIILIGQDTSLYGIDLYGKKKLAKLLDKLERLSSDNWIRILYCHPANLDREVLKIINESKNICKYIDLPIEHISDNILKRMARNTTKMDILNLIDNIREIIPDAAIRTSFIVGFPGETEEDFKELLAFIKKTRFERLGLFKYSREEGTPAYSYKPQIPEKVKEARFDELMSVQQDIAREVNERFRHRILKVLIDGREVDNFIGRTEYDAPEVDGVVYINGEDLKIGNFYDVRITDTYEYDLVGEVV